MDTDKLIQRFDEVTVFKLLRTKMYPRIADRFATMDASKMSKMSKIQTSAYFSGEIGTGKTMAAVFCTIQIFRKNYIEGKPRPSFIFVNVSDLLAEIRQSFDPASTITELQIVEKYTSFDIIILDELGAEPPTDWVVRTLYLIINRLYEQMKTIFVTSNFSIDQLPEKLNDLRIVRRIDEMCTTIELTGSHFKNDK
jgi:DNA replication protein DnaC